MVATKHIPHCPSKISDLLDFYDKKSKEPAGGCFFSVYDGARLLDTEWSFDGHGNDVKIQYNKQRIRFTHLVALRG